MPTTNSGIYASKFAASINNLCSSKNIKSTAQRFKALEQAKGGYSFGEFAKLMLPNQSDWGGKAPYNAWDADVKGIPAALRQQLTDAIRTNLESARPLPMFLKVGDNVEPKHDLIVKTFVYSRKTYVGILMLCPNPEKPR